MSARKDLSGARRAGAATGLAAFAIVAGYWLLRLLSGTAGTPGVETILLRAGAAALAGYFVGLVLYGHGKALVAEAAGDEDGGETDAAGDGTEPAGEPEEQQIDRNL